MAKVDLLITPESERYVKSGDVLICDDESKWLIIRLESSDFMLYDLETSKYMLLEKSYIKYQLNSRLPENSKKKVTDVVLARATNVRLDIVNKKLGSRYGCREMESQVLRGEDLTIKFEIPCL
jgi:hypothetical protein